MPTYHRRCHYMDHQGLQCETWFPIDEKDSKLCPIHSEVASPNHSPEQKVLYIDLVNMERAICHKMTHEELDAHIAGLEVELEKARNLVLTAKAVKRDNLDKLTEEERKELRKIKVQKLVTEAKPKTVSVKKDPIAHLMASKNMSANDAKDLLYMDEDALLEKFRAMKALKENKS